MSRMGHSASPSGPARKQTPARPEARRANQKEREEVSEKRGLPSTSPKLLQGLEQQFRRRTCDKTLAARRSKRKHQQPCRRIFRLSLTLQLAVAGRRSCPITWAPPYGDDFVAGQLASLGPLYRIFLEATKLTACGKGWRTPARASVGRRCCGGVGGGSRATPKGRNRGRADAVSSGVVLWGFERARCDWGRWRWRCCRHTRRKGRLCAVPDVGFWEIGSDSGPGLHGGRPSAGTPVAGGPAQVARSCFDWRCASWSTKRPRRRPDMKRRR